MGIIGIILYWDYIYYYLLESWNREYSINYGIYVLVSIYLWEYIYWTPDIGNIPMYWFQYIYILGIYLLESWNWFQYIYGIYLLDPEYSINSNVPPCIGSFFFFHPLNQKRLVPLSPRPLSARQIRPSGQMWVVEEIHERDIGFIWFYMVLYGFIWKFYMVLYGFIWFYGFLLKRPHNW
jgi:hypothetical protein